MSEPSVVDTPVEGPHYREAFEGQLAEIKSLPLERIRDVNVNVWSAANIALAAMPRLRAQKDKLASTFAKFDPAQIELLEKRALALNYSQRLLKADAPESSPYADKLEIATRKRDLVRANLESLSQHGIFDGTRLKELQGGNAHRFVADDLFVLHQIATANWSAIAGKTPLTQPELDEIEMLAHEVGVSVAERQQESKSHSESMAIRDRAYSLFAETYESVRADVAYLAAKEGIDADDILPSIFAGRASGKKPQAATTPPASAAAVPGTPVVAASGAAAHDAPVGPAARVGLPGSSPFSS